MLDVSKQNEQKYDEEPLMDIKNPALYLLHPCQYFFPTFFPGILNQLYVSVEISKTSILFLSFFQIYGYIVEPEKLRIAPAGYGSVLTLAPIRLSYTS